MAGMRSKTIWVGLALSIAGCVDGSPTLMGTEGSSGGGGSSSGGPIVEDVTGPPPPTSTATTTSTTVASTSGPDDTTAAGSSGMGMPSCEGGCPMLDVVFVVDNTSTMGANQLRLAQAAEALLDELAALEAQTGQLFDLHLMVTSSDFGNPLCTPFQPAGYEPARGAPVSTACTDRLQDFTSLGGTTVMPEVCTDVCPVGVAPAEPFVAMVGTNDNVPEGTALEALRCLLPQGIVGCGYESPLENMLQALNPSAAWNGGVDPFLRSGADLAIVLLTDESDCSVKDYSIMEDPAFMNVNPDTGMPAPTSAMCWNVGVACNGPDAMGVYSDCIPTTDELLQPTTRYTNYLVDELAGNQGKEVMMLTLVGVPPVVQHSTRAPFEPTVGGVDDLVVHDWIDGPYPAGEILPDEWAVGVDADHKTYQLGIGPGCTGEDPVHGLMQAQPPIRIQQVCEALDAQGGTRCCMESICDDDLGPAMTCLRGMIETSL